MIYLNKKATKIGNGICIFISKKHAETLGIVQGNILTITVDNPHPEIIYPKGRHNSPPETEVQNATINMATPDQTQMPIN